MSLDFGFCVPLWGAYDSKWKAGVELWLVPKFFHHWNYGSSIQTSMKMHSPEGSSSAP